MSRLRGIFLSGHRQKRIEAAHMDCVAYVGNYASCMSTGYVPTLFDVVIQCRSQRAAPALHTQLFQTWMTGLTAGMLPMFETLGVYSLTDISQKRAAFEFMLKFRNIPGFWQALFRPDPSPDMLSALSLHAAAPSTLLYIKYFFLYLHHRDPGKYSLKSYEGVPAMTSPVQKACETLWGRRIHDLDAKDMHSNLAADLGISELEVNTALWTIGS